MYKNPVALFQQFSNLDILPLISLSYIICFNKLTDAENYQSVWHQTHFDVTDKNYNISFEGLNIHVHYH
jgi:hypothetical protein